MLRFPAGGRDISSFTLLCHFWASSALPLLRLAPDRAQRGRTLLQPGTAAMRLAQVRDQGVDLGRLVAARGEFARLR